MITARAAPRLAAYVPRLAAKWWVDYCMSIDLGFVGTAI
jgi:hypothetical protein